MSNPSRLYYLTSEHWAKVILSEKKLKLSKVSELNDPFELLGASIGEKRVRKILHFVHKRLSEQFGLLCMSTTWQSPVMWAHYGDKHRGVCLGFDVIDQGADKVIYEPSRLNKLLGSKPSLENVSTEVIKKLFTTKSTEWAYEKEQRIIVNFSNAQPDDKGLYFVPFNNEALTLREVILGSRCEWSLKEAAQLLGTVQHETLLKRVRPSFHHFKMVQQRNEPLVRLKPKLRSMTQYPNEALNK